jgi:hypothetical protein
MLIFYRSESLNPAELQKNERKMFTGLEVNSDDYIKRASSEEQLVAAHEYMQEYDGRKR